MKLVIAVIQDYDTNTLLTAFSNNGIMATRIASAGGFLRQGNTTVFSAVEDDQVPLVKRLLASNCGNREDPSAEEQMRFVDADEFEHFAASRIGGGVAFVARLAHFEKVPRAVPVEETESGSRD